MFLLLPTTGIPVYYFPFLAGPGPLPEIAVSAFSRVPNSSMSYSSIFLISSYTSHSSLYISHSPTCACYSLLLCNKAHLCTFLLFPTTGIPVYYFPFLAGPGPLPEIAVSAFSRSPSCRANTFYSYLLFHPPRIFLSVPPLPPYFLALVFPFFHLFYFCLVPPELLYGQYTFLVSSCPSILSRLRSSILFQLGHSSLSPIQRYYRCLLLLFSH